MLNVNFTKKAEILKVINAGNVFNRIVEIVPVSSVGLVRAKIIFGVLKLNNFSEDM